MGARFNGTYFVTTPTHSLGRLRLHHALRSASRSHGLAGGAAMKQMDGVAIGIGKRHRREARSSQG